MYTQWAFIHPFIQHTHITLSPRPPQGRRWMLITRQGRRWMLITRQARRRRLKITRKCHSQRVERCPHTVLSTPCWLRASNQYCITFTLTQPVGCEPASNVALYSNSVRWRARQPVGCEPYAPMMPHSMLISQAWIGSIWSMIGKYMIGGCT